MIKYKTLPLNDLSPKWGQMAVSCVLGVSRVDKIRII